MSSIAKIHYIFILCILLSSCFKQVDYPIQPEVTYNSFIIFGNNDSAQISIDFTDGDGDIGLNDNDTFPPFDFDGDNYYNLFLHYYEKNDSLGWIEGRDFNGKPIIFNFRVHQFLPDDQSKSIQGTIKYSFNLFYNIGSLESDTIKYKFQIKDRELHESNFGETDEILIL